MSLNGAKNNPLIFNSKNYDSIRFERSVLHKYEGTEENDVFNEILSHCKVLVILKNKKISDDTIIYIGSHNLTMAA